MGDRYDRTRKRGLHPALRGLPKPPPEIIGWGLSAPARIGHNQGPPLEEPVADAFVRYRWRKAHAEVWKNPPLSILKLRVQRAKAAGVSYREYMLELLDSGRHLQAADVAKPRAQAAASGPAKPQPLAPSGRGRGR
ncbi:MAG TPA: hypothetical protein VFR19_10060 [Hyphomicrobiaceae bacterium]|jgi:hypothetical protein|nr:hypothetical protein [Hyphomicrobiaceae bacterium]